MGIFPKGEDSRGDHSLGRLVEFRFKGPPGTTSFYITTHIIGTTLMRLMGFPDSEVSYTSAMPRREDQEVHKDMWGHWGKNKKVLIPVSVQRTSHVKADMKLALKASSFLQLNGKYQTQWTISQTDQICHKSVYT